MAKKKPRFESQLFLFADDFSPLLEDWFAGNVIFEYDLIPNNQSIISPQFTNDEELEIFNLFVEEFDVQYKKARLILNYSEIGLFMYGLTASNSHAYKLIADEDYKKLKKLRKALDYYKVIKHNSNQFNFLSSSFQSYVKPISKNDLAKLKTVSKSTAESINTYLELTKQQLHNSFTSYFSALK